MRFPAECFIGHTNGEVCSEVIGKLYKPLGFEIGPRTGEFVTIYPPAGWRVHPEDSNSIFGPGGAFLKKGVTTEGMPIIVSHIFPKAVIFQN